LDHAGVASRGKGRHISVMENDKAIISLHLKQLENRILLDAINQALESAPLDEDEKLSLQKMYRRRRQIPASEW
jgi:hypothetical protein